MSKLPWFIASAALLGLSLASAAAPPVNDTCGAATPITQASLPYTQALDTTQATSDGDPAVACAPQGVGKSVWYSFRPEASGVYVFDASGSTPVEYQPILALYMGSCNNLTLIPGACASRRLTATLVAGTSYYLLAAGAPFVVSPSIRIAANGVDLCPGGAGPGGGSCGGNLVVHAGDQIVVRAYNDLNDTLLTAGTFSWNLGANANPATATGPSATYTYTAPIASTTVTLTWTPPGQSALTRQVNLVVEGSLNPHQVPPDAPGPRPLAAGDTATLPSPGGTLRLSVRRDIPDWRFTNVIPSVANQINAAGVPFVSDVSIANLESTETQVGMELWTAAGSSDSTVLRIPGGGSVTIADVVKNAFGLSQTFGTLLVSSTGAVSVGARTWAPVASGGTNGQFLLAGDASSSLSPFLLQTGEVGVLAGVRQDSAFRTNIGVFNLSPTPCVVEVEAHDDQGRLVGTKLVLTVPAERYVQEQLGSITGGSFSSGSVSVTNAAAGCSIGTVAYVIDNATQDPFAVPQRKKQ